ncbi:hypothetical protein SAY87_028871 [Trapa incisa]|uniref:Crossover junction endonuclease MUS81-like HHH domain-containing protein n=1 Tax=Trapa incisa TaxID=236973 RepID=A0AAN7QPR0_9MYRT|nr:hypothetical protein SAY87_028871 [Trapa incisa]
MNSLNRNLTEIFGKFINIYRALGDDGRSYNYYKAIPVIEKLPFKIESAEHVKHLPSSGKSMQEHMSDFISICFFSLWKHHNSYVVIVDNISFRHLCLDWLLSHAPLEWSNLV